MVKVSVIVPIYGVEKYLDKCLKSLVNQTLDEIQIICVNDGSPDNSQEIINNYIAKYPDKVLGLKKENGGLSDARNYGIPYAQGEYIAFCDSDDWVESTMYEHMYKKAKEDNSDIVICQINDVYEKSGNIIKGGFESPKESFNLHNNKQALFGLSPVAWDKIYKKNLFLDNQIVYPKGLKYEDVGTTPMLFLKANVISGVDDYAYNYLQRDSSITKAFDKSIFDKLSSLERVKNYYIDQGEYEFFEVELEYFFIRHALFNMFHLIRHVDKSVGRKAAIKKIFLFMKKHFPNWKNNQYLAHDFEMEEINHGLLSRKKFEAFVQRIYYTNGLSLYPIWVVKDFIIKKSPIEKQEEEQLRTSVRKNEKN